MRIHELAKELKVSSGVVLQAAKSQGMELTNALSSLNEDEVRRIRSGFATSAAKSASSAGDHGAALAAKRARAEAARLAKAKAEQERLAVIQDKARAIERELKSAGKAPVSKAPVPEQKVEAPKPAPAPAAPRKAPAKAEGGSSLNLGDLGNLTRTAPAFGDSKVIFHPAADDDYESDDEDDGSYRRRDDDVDSEEGLAKDYLSAHKGQASGKRSTTRPRDDARDEGARDHRNLRGGNHGAQQPFGGRAPSQPQGGRDSHFNSRQQGGRFGQGPRGQQAGGNYRSNPSGVHGGAQPFPTRPQAGRQPFPTRPQAQPFPTRPQAQPFPTRPQAGRQPFPTRPQAQHFPTRPQAQPFPTRPQGGRQPFPTRPQGGSQGFQRGGRAAQQNGKFQNGKGARMSQQNGRFNQRPQNQPPVAPVMASAEASLPGADKLLSLRGPVLVRELAEMMGLRPNKLIADLMQHNILASINQRVDYDMAGKIAEKYGYKVELERAKRSSERKPALRRLDEEDDIPEDKPEDMKPRPPVVTFLGHVDHGKTSLLDYLRKSTVASGEAGGITQHIGAYSVDVNDRKITFLDTPGHAAFSAMRVRGAKLTDIAVIVVAADDGIMPQTREVIKDCRQANVQMMVAINKCDLPSAKPDNVRVQLQAEGLTPEEWGGDIICCEVSARTGAGMDHLLEMILLQSDMLELQANPNRRADGYIIEAQMELGRGPTATLLVASGTLKLGDVVLIDEHYGRLRGLIDDRGRKVKSVGPAQAVRVMGLSGVPEAGAEFRVMTNEKRAKELAEKFAQERKEMKLEEAQKSVSIDSLLDKLNEQQKEKKELSVIVKADTQGTVEAIIDTLRDFRSEKITLEILSSSIGNINANDVQRAAAGNAMIVGFQVNTEAGVAPQATHDGARINTFRIIYELFDFVKQSMLDKLDPEYREVVIGHAQIRQVFDIGKKGRVAGCQLIDGSIRTKNARVRIRRNRDQVWDGRISSLRHFQDEVPEVKDLQECGIFFDGFEDFKEGDVVECYAMEEMERTL